jgi:hypothetical protein
MAQEAQKAIFIISSEESAERKAADDKDREEGIASAIFEKQSLADAICSRLIPDKIVKVALQDTYICSVSGESPSEELANFLTHGIGLILSIIGFIFLVSSAFISADPWITFGSFVYALTLILMYCTSTLYHLCKTLHIKKRLRILDHV